MTEDRAERKIKALRRLTVQNGATLAEAASAADLANLLEQRYKRDSTRSLGEAWSHVLARRALSPGRRNCWEILAPPLSFVGKAILAVAFVWVAMLMQEAIKSANCGSNGVGAECRDWSHPFWP